MTSLLMSHSPSAMLCCWLFSNHVQKHLMLLLLLLLYKVTLLVTWSSVDVRPWHMLYIIAMLYIIIFIHHIGLIRF